MKLNLFAIECNIINKGDLVFHGSVEDLKEQRKGNKLLIGFSKVPTIAKLRAIKSVSKVEKDGNGMFRFHFKEKYLPAEEIVNLSVKEGWGLYHINMDITSNVKFVNLTKSDCKPEN